MVASSSQSDSYRLLAFAALTSSPLADWKSMTMQELASFVDSTFGKNIYVVKCFHEIFGSFMASAEEEDEEPVSAPTPAKPAKPQQAHAAWFCSEIRRVYGMHSPTYRGFIQTMNNYAQKDKDTLGTIKAIKELFVDNPNLVLEFANFVPGSFKKYCVVDKASGKRKSLEAAAAAPGLTTPTLTSAVEQKVLGSAQMSPQQVMGASHMMHHGRIQQHQQQSPGQQQRMEQQQQRDLYSKFQQQQMLQHAGSEMKKRKMSEGDGAASSLHGNSHSLSAMCAQYHHQPLLYQKQHIQEAQLQQPKHHQMTTASIAHQFQQLNLAQEQLIQKLLQDPNLLAKAAASKGAAPLHASSLLPQTSQSGGQIPGQPQVATTQHATLAALIHLLQPPGSHAASLSGALGNHLPTVSVPATGASILHPTAPSQSVMGTIQSSSPQIAQAGLSGIPLRPAGPYAQSLCAGANTTPPLVQNTMGQNAPPPDSAASIISQLQTQCQALGQSSNASDTHNGTSAGGNGDGVVAGIPQMDGAACQVGAAGGEASLPQLDGADADMDQELDQSGSQQAAADSVSDLTVPALSLAGHVHDDKSKVSRADERVHSDAGRDSFDRGDTHREIEGHGRTPEDDDKVHLSRAVEIGSKFSRSYSEPIAGAAAMARDTSKRVIKPRERDLFYEPHVAKKADGRAGKASSDEARPPVKANESKLSKQQSEHLKALIQQAAEKPGTQECHITGRVIRVPDLVSAIKEKGMDNGNVVWAHVAVVLGIDIKRCHNYSVKLLQLLEGTSSAKAANDGDESRRKKAKSKGISKRPSGMVAPLAGGKKTKAPVFINRMAHFRALEAEKDLCSIRNTKDGSYITLKLLTGVNKSDREDFVHFLPKNANQMVPREGALLARHAGARKAAMLAQRLWVTTIFDSVKRSDALQERLKRQRMAKEVNVEGWDMKRLGNLVEAAAMGQGFLHWSQAQGRLCRANLTPGKIAELGVLSDDTERQVRRFLGQVHREINKDPRICCLCRIVGDSGVQGRLLYVELNAWAHVNCLCWSKGVYEMPIEKNIGRIGMLCNVHDVVGKARQKLCHFCGCPGATVMCHSQGCCTVSHFGCAILQKWSFFSEGRAFCDCCEKSSEAESCGGTKDAWAPIHLYKLTSKHLRVMPRARPKLLEALEPQRLRKGTALSKKRKGVAEVPFPQSLSSDYTSTPGAVGLPDSAVKQLKGPFLESDSTAMNAGAVSAKPGDIMSASLFMAGAGIEPKESGITSAGATASSSVNAGTSQSRDAQGEAGERRVCRWTAHTDKVSGRTYFHNHDTKESVWTKPAELMTPPRLNTSSGGGQASEYPENDGGDGSIRAMRVDNLLQDSSRLDSSRPTPGVFANAMVDAMTEKRLRAIDLLFKQCAELKSVAMEKAEAREDNCLLGWASCAVTDETCFFAQLGKNMSADREGILTGRDDATEYSAMQLRSMAERVVSEALSKINVHEVSPKTWKFDKAGHVSAVSHVQPQIASVQAKRPADIAEQHKLKSPIAGGMMHSVIQSGGETGNKRADDHEITGKPAQVASHENRAKALPPKAKERTRAADAAAEEAAQRERDEGLNREQWDAYETNLLSNVAVGMQEGSVMARIGSLTVRRLGRIKTDDDNYHSEVAIYPIGYMSNRVCFAPGEIQSKAGQQCRRAVYTCQIVAGEQGGPPLFQVSVENESFLGSSSTQAWELATRRSLRLIHLPLSL